METVLDLVPGALVLGLLLAPDDLLRGLEGCEGLLELLLREGIELLDADDGDIREPAGSARLPCSSVSRCR